ncbi:MAG: hypothetical protein V7K92_29530 [Nostoc sp.]|uniref:hypothetical protein n=1 Tax=Nostoc sp. TaxID=1180 RepID=UPI002FF35E55
MAQPHKEKSLVGWVSFLKRRLQGSSVNRLGAVAPQPTQYILCGFNPSVLG